MNDTDSGSLEAPASAQLGGTAEVDILPELGAHPTDRSMLVVQYALALVAAITAILLTQAS